MGFAHAQTPNGDPVLYAGQDRTFAFHDAAGSSDTTAIPMSDPQFVAWATGYTNLVYGTNVSSIWQTPAKALGPAIGVNTDTVALGRGGEITLTFTNPIVDGPGFDFAVFENSFDDRFLELAWVEVSTDGVHFVRFPNLSYTENPVGGFSDVEPTFVHGFAGKYRIGYGTPFDLSELTKAYQAASNDSDDAFTPEYKTALLANYGHPDFDINNIRYVRLIDVVGDGSARDVDGNVDDGSGLTGAVIYDPYPTIGSAGFDLEAVGVINQMTVSGDAQTIDFALVGNQRLSDQTVVLFATATSGLEVSFTVMEGPASVSGSTLSLNGIGQVIVQATQAGDATYAAAPPVTQSFYVADALQHIFVQPLPNQLVDAVDVPIKVLSSSGLPVSLFVESGPISATVGETSHLFSSGAEAGLVTLRASQSGGMVDGIEYAPAEDVELSFEIVASGASTEPKTFVQWQMENSISGSAETDSDLDGSDDFEEYVAGTNPNDSSDRRVAIVQKNGGGFVLEYTISGQAVFDLSLETSSDLTGDEGWTSLLPEIESIERETINGKPIQTLRFRLEATSMPAGFWRIVLNEPTN